MTAERKAYAAAYYLANKEKVNAACKAYYEANKASVLKTNKAYFDANRETTLAYYKAWRAANPVKARAIVMAWRAARPQRVAEYRASRRAHQRKALPRWADRQAIHAFYDFARALTKATGIKYTVDHIVPLRGRIVSGLHVENNLRVITHSENAAKGFSFLPA